MRLALIGVGLIGASAAWAMKRGGVFETVSAFDLSAQSARKAVEMGIPIRRPIRLKRAFREPMPYWLPCLSLPLKRSWRRSSLS